jgi:predicted ATPase
MKSLTSKKQLSKIVLEGFKSIAQCELELSALNVLIGCNGAGKSNFIDFFRMISQILDEKLQVYVGKQGGPDAILHFGRKKTEQLKAELYFGNNGYKFTLEATRDNRLMFADENFWWNVKGDWDISSGHFESRVESQKGNTKIYDFTVPAMKSWRVYHFHDTGENSPIKQQHALNDNVYLRPNGQNLAAFLYLLKKKHPDNYMRIVKTIRLVAPFFGNFHLRPSPHNEEMIELEWIEKDQDVPFKAHHFSDGTLRFICLTTVLLQPTEKQPETILIDEPELGLHPYAIKVLASLMKTASKEKQIIVSTQSVELLDEFDVEDIIIVDRKDGKSSIHRLNENDLTEWLQEYSLGELWKKNLLGGRPAR